MSTKAAVEHGSSWDTAKLAVAVAVLVGSLVAFYYFADASKLLRVVGMIAAVGVAIGIALQTDKGRQISAFLRDSQVEVRKVVWPTRQETTQVTLVVIGVVIVFAFLLWGLDWVLGALIQTLIGRGA
ncbi:MAG: preprotein translocase subunit SecE [Gammaproteobacteria bacterium]|nr:preprotein translocase subunit SecE [Gammaproteobacteria bacterium]MCP5199275.1 preprotein translocase subunit SecE [Gammaproteobacteria bacterium]